MPIKQLASISIPESRMIVIQPWDKSILSEIEKAIQKSDLGINPTNDGKLIRLIFPPPYRAAAQGTGEGCKEAG